MWWIDLIFLIDISFIDINRSSHTFYSYKLRTTTAVGPSDITSLPKSSPSFARPVALTMESNYQAWSDQMVFVFKAIGLYEVAIEGAV